MSESAYWLRRKRRVRIDLLEKYDRPHCVRIRYPWSAKTLLVPAGEVETISNFTARINEMKYRRVVEAVKMHGEKALTEISRTLGHCCELAAWQQIQAAKRRGLLRNE